MMGYQRIFALLHIFTNDTAMEHIKTLGKGAFHLLSVYPADHHLLAAMKWYMPSIRIVFCSKTVQYLSRPAFMHTGPEHIGVSHMMQTNIYI